MKVLDFVEFDKECQDKGIDPFADGCYLITPPNAVVLAGNFHKVPAGFTRVAASERFVGARGRKSAKEYDTALHETTVIHSLQTCAEDAAERQRRKIERDEIREKVKGKAQMQLMAATDQIRSNTSIDPALATLQTVFGVEKYARDLLEAA